MTSLPSRVPERPWPVPPFLQLTLLIHLGAALWLVWQPADWIRVLALLALNHLLITVLGLWPRSRWLGENIVRLPAAARVRGEVALTIDDGPDPALTPRVLAQLDAAGVKATFFCIGERVLRHPELVREILARGHAVENHSQRHRHHFSLLGPRGYERELRAAQLSFAQVTGSAPRLFRAPAGLRNPFLAPVLHRLGLHLVSWTARGFDTREGDPARVLRRLTARLEAGDILLLHDSQVACTPGGTPVVLAVLPALLERIAAAGLKPVLLGEALGLADLPASRALPAGSARGVASALRLPSTTT